ncbi:hypothetical protein RHSIM_Rhsim12G0184900 [Rhododendron simsii]|uniref:Protein kinase domain-containing protein n=1 Tax=Rhododendron simsii TaxID=118357 RepID=A0A834G3Z3_RHOSS|nr:hypothetical protein RHSIM_Rhsim12G0184900 [Rhododendron simsii]
MVFRKTMLVFLLHCLVIIPKHALSVLQHHYPSHHSLETDRAALLEFKETITSDPNSRLSNWNDSTQVCYFTSVRCNKEHHRVWQLNLGGSGIVGTLSPSISNLTHLRVLELVNNQLSGEIPWEFSSLRHLRRLLLEGNNLHGQIPDTFSLLPKLTVVDLQLNRLTDTFSHLVNLTEVDLRLNSLTGKIPPSFFSNCTSLKNVDLSLNFLEGNIPEIGSCRGLWNLNLYNNQLTGEIPFSITNATSMVNLDVEYNFLSGELPSKIVECLPDLVFLHFSFNAMISPENNSNLDTFFTVLCNYTSVIELELAGMGLGGKLPTSIGKCVYLEYLLLQENNIAGSIPPTLSNLTHLSQLNLTSNLLSGTIPEEISQLPHLEQLFLSHNSLSGPIPAAVGQFQHLGLLHLSNNKFSGEIPKSLGNLVEINSMFLNNNLLSGSIPSSLGQCRDLYTLDLSYNNLTGNIPPEISGLREMRIFINLSHNFLEGDLPIELSKLENVQEMDLSLNRFTGCVFPRISSCIALSSLNISHNLLEGELPESLGDLKNLKVFDVSGNGLSGTIPKSLSNIRTLTFLNLSVNQLSGTIPSGGIFDSVTYLSFLLNRNLCGPIPGIPSCHKSTKKLTTFLIIFGIVISLSFAFLAVRYLKVVMSAGKAEPETEPQPEWIDFFPRITYKELFDATGGFDEQWKLGSGSSGRVYRGVLPDGTCIAVKVLQLQTGSPTKNFNRECQVLKSIRHRNLIRIKTTCSLPDFKALVLPYMENGSLESWLYPHSGTGLSITSRSSGLTLIQRNHYNGRIERVVDSSLVKAMRDQSPEEKKMWEVAIEELTELGILCTLDSPSTRPTMLDAADDLARLKHRLKRHALSVHHSLETDRTALLEFKRTITADPNSRLSNWNDSTHVCYFTGVMCNKEHHRVWQLNLNDSGIVGLLSPFISNLTHLRVLELVNNHLSGEIPPEFSSLRDLQHLLLEGNDIHGQIPDTFSLLVNLSVVDLRQNRLTGNLPPSFFSNCTLLKNVDLSFNFLEGNIPEIGSCRGLWNLNLFNNQFTGEIPFSITNATSMVNLDVEYNFLSGELPSKIVESLPDLEFLHLSFNPMISPENNSNLDPFFTALCNYTTVVELELAGMGLGGKLPTSIGKCVYLESLLLEENNITGSIPPTLSNLTYLSQLNLTSNLLSGTIPEEISQLPHLQRLFLSHNSLSGPIPAVVGQFQHLGLLDLSNNKFSGEIPKSLGNLVEINSMFLNNNLLSGSIPSSLVQCRNLYLLDLSYNNLSGNIPPEITGLREIRTFLNLSHNFLEGDLPIELSKLENVQEMDLSSNRFTGHVSPWISSCIALSLLNISHNRLEGELPESLGDLKNLEVLDVSVNHLFGTIPKSLSNIRTLTFLNLSINQFSGTIPSGGIFDSATSSSFLPNGNLCGSIPGIPSCHKSTKKLFRNATLLIIFCIVISLSVSFSVVCWMIGRRYLKVIISAEKLELETETETKSQPGLIHNLPRITYKELFDATGGFDEQRKLGSGSSGRVYKGVLPNGMHIAVKVLQLQTGNPTKSFNRECQVLKRIRHRNLIRIITTCSLSDFKAIVLPYMANGSLDSWLFPPSGPGVATSSRSSDLSLIQRVNICSDIAEGMAYLHHHSPVRIERAVDPLLVKAMSDQTPEVKKMWEVAIGELTKLGILCTQDSPSTRPTMLDAADDLDCLKRYLMGDTTATFASTLGISSSTVGNH